MDKIKAAWAAGLFEGEGCITVTRNTISMSLTSTDRDVIDKFRKIVGCGNIYIKSVQTNTRREAYVWSTTHLDEIRILERAFRRHLGKRRRARFSEVIAQVVEHRRKSGYRPTGRYGYRVNLA